MSPQPTQRGFTLVELLVVVLIIGVLAAIALPRFLGQRTRSKNAAAQAAARHALVAARSYYTQNSESYAGLGPTQLRGYESSLSGSEPADTVRPGDSDANPQDIWIGNGLGSTNPDTVAGGDPNGGNTVVLCSVSKGDTVYCVKDVSGVATYLSATGGSVLAAAGGSFSASGWSSAAVSAPSNPPTAGTPTVSGTAQQGNQLAGSAGSWSSSPAITDWAWVWRRCDSAGANCNDISGASGTASGSSAPTIASYTLVAGDVGSTIRLQVQAQNSSGSCSSGVNCTTASSSATGVVAAVGPCPGGTQSGNTCTYSTAGTYSWNAPAGVSSVTVQAWGGGGSGASNTYPGGGGGGAFASGTASVTAGNSYTVVVGNGGAVVSYSSLGNIGGDSYFNTTGTVMAKGGGTTPSTAGVGGPGGAAASSVGTTRFSGGTGGWGCLSGSSIWGGGGGGAGGSANAGSNGTSSGCSGTGGAGGSGGATGGGAGGKGGASNTSNPADGSPPGGGGGGSGCTQVSTVWGCQNSGAGAAGQIKVSW